jgi:hypothetical protein
MPSVFADPSTAVRQTLKQRRGRDDIDSADQDGAFSFPRPDGHVAAGLIFGNEKQRKKRDAGESLLPTCSLRRSSSRFIGRAAATALGGRAQRGLEDPGEFPHSDPSMPCSCMPASKLSGCTHPQLPLALALLSRAHLELTVSPSVTGKAPMHRLGAATFDREMRCGAEETRWPTICPTTRHISKDLATSV